MFLKGCVIEPGVFICAGNDLRTLTISNKEAGEEHYECAMQCASTEGCVGWTFSIATLRCWLKSDDSCKGNLDGWISGNKDCGSSSTYL